MRILHLVGSPSSELAFQCSQLYAKSLLQSDYAAVINNTNIVAVVHLDGSWSFPQNCDKLSSGKRFGRVEALVMVMALKVDIMVQHIVCEAKHQYNALFELLNIPYIGADSHAQANIADKGVSRAILAEAGLPVPEGVILVRGEDDPELAYTGPFPAVVKPTLMENSVGVEMVRSTQEMRAAIEGAWSYGDTAIVDRFIPGREVRCGVVELRPGLLTPLGVLEYKVDRQRIRAYEDKLEGDGEKLRQAASTVTWFLDPEEEGDLVTRLQQVATSVHRVMGARDFSQIDCRVTEDGEIFVLEVNAFCSFGPLSLIPKLANKVGISSSVLYSSLLENARRRLSNKILNDDSLTHTKGRMASIA